MSLISLLQDCEMREIIGGASAATVASASPAMRISAVSKSSNMTRVAQKGKKLKVKVRGFGFGHDDGEDDDFDDD